MIGLVKRYGTLGLVVALALALAAIGLQQARIANCKRSAAEQEEARTNAHLTALKEQQEKFDHILTAEAKRRTAVESQNRDLVKQVEQLRDYHEKLADSVRVYVNGLFNRARAEYGGANAEDPGAPSADRADAGKEPAGEGG